MNRKDIAREIDFVDNIMQNHFNDYGEETHRALQEAIKLIEQKPKILERDEVARRLGTVDVYAARSWTLLLKDLEYLGLGICEVNK